MKPRAVRLSAGARIAIDAAIAHATAREHAESERDEARAELKAARAELARRDAWREYSRAIAVEYRVFANVAEAALDDLARELPELGARVAEARERASAEALAAFGRALAVDVATRGEAPPVPPLARVVARR